MDVTLTAEPRPETGTSEARRLRRAGRLPAVVYGAEIEGAIPVSVGRRELLAALSTTAGLNALITLQVDGAPHLTLARELQRHPVRNEVIHVDFIAIRRDQEVEAEVPVLFEGEAPAERNDLVVTHNLTMLAITALPGNVPTQLAVDVTGLVNAGDSIRAGEIGLPDGVTLMTDPDEVVAMVSGQAAAEEPTAAEEAAAEEAAAAEAGEGGAAESADE